VTDEVIARYRQTGVNVDECVHLALGAKGDLARDWKPEADDGVSVPVTGELTERAPKPLSPNKIMDRTRSSLRMTPGIRSVPFRSSTASQSSPHTPREEGIFHGRRRPSSPDCGPSPCDRCPPPLV